MMRIGARKKFERLQNELERLFSHFRGQEKRSLIMPVVPDDAFLCVRLDGIKMSKRLLKDRLTHPDFDEDLLKATAQTYRIWRGWLPKEYINLFLGAIIVSDEVSLILNRCPNYFEQRICKTVTSLAGTLSSALTIEQLQARDPYEVEGAEVMAFDARPLVLDSLNDVRGYLRWRWILSCRNAMCKVLRLCTTLHDDDIYKTDLRHSILLASQEIDRRHLWDEYEDAASGFSLLVPADDNIKQLASFPLPAAPDNPNRAIARVTKVYRQLNAG